MMSEECTLAESRPWLLQYDPPSNERDEASRDEELELPPSPTPAPTKMRSRFPRTTLAAATGLFCVLYPLYFSALMIFSLGTGVMLFSSFTRGMLPFPSWTPLLGGCMSIVGSLGICSQASCMSLLVLAHSIGLFVESAEPLTVSLPSAIASLPAVALVPITLAMAAGAVIGPLLLGRLIYVPPRGQLAFAAFGLVAFCVGLTATAALIAMVTLTGAPIGTAIAMSR